MDTGSALLRAQELDLEAGRLSAELADLPELCELARKRKSLKRLRSELKHLVGLQKDIEIDIDDLDIDRKNVEHDVEAATTDQGASTEYRRVAELEERLSSLAKQLDKIEFERAAREKELADCVRKKEEVEAYVERFEKSILDDAARARERATDVMGRLDDAKKGFMAALEAVGEDLAREYRALKDAKGGIAVERLDGDVPSVCRMRLTEASLSDIARDGSLARCPNCGRILVIGEDR